MRQEHPRLSREKRTVAAMVRITCRDQHGAEHGLCEPCQALLDYALERLDKCPFQADKPTCAKCPIHCYRPSRREEIRAVMGYAGPRMMWQHPLLALSHLIDGLFYRSSPERAREDQTEDTSEQPRTGRT